MPASILAIYRLIWIISPDNCSSGKISSISFNKFNKVLSGLPSSIKGTSPATLFIVLKILTRIAFNFSYSEITVNLSKSNACNSLIYIGNKSLKVKSSSLSKSEYWVISIGGEWANILVGFWASKRVWFQ